MPEEERDLSPERYGKTTQTDLTVLRLAAARLRFRANLDTT